MIHFLDAAADGAWMAELKDAGLLAPDKIELIHGLMGRPETGTLNEFLLAGADIVSEPAWLCWLIRLHGCHRYGKAVWRSEAVKWAQHGIPPDGNLPYRECGDQTLMVAVLRPDLLQSGAEGLRKTRCLRAAATLREARELHSAWRRASVPARGEVSAARCRDSSP
jgi:hypothetical protein